MSKRVICASLVALLTLTVVAGAALKKTRLSKRDFTRIEYKIQLNLKNLDATEPMNVTMKKIGEQLTMFSVGGNADPNGYSAYVDAPGLILEKSDYILRLKGNPSNPGKCKGTLKLRTTDPTKLVKLKGKRLSAGGWEIDHPGKDVYAIAYGLRFNQAQDFRDGKVDGKLLMKAIERGYPDCGAHLRKILGDKELVVPPYVPRYGSWASLKADAIPETDGHKKGMDMELFKFEDEIMVELSWSTDLSNKRDAKIYKGIIRALKKADLLGEKQMTKTSYYLDYWFNRNADKLPTE